MAIAVLGDVHNTFVRMKQVLEQLPDDVTEVIQVGDLGLWPPGKYRAEEWLPTKVPMRFIGGNHEYEPEIADLTEPTEVRPGLTYMPRGWVQEIDGRLVGFLGGGHSVDLPYRTEGHDYWKSEEILQEHVDRLAWAGKLDLLITHVPPAFLVRGMFGYKANMSDYMVQMAWEQAGRPPLVCGHMHEHKRYDNILVLDILELALV